MKANGRHRWENNECVACGLRRTHIRGKNARWVRIYYIDRNNNLVLGQQVPYRCVMMPDDQYAALIEWRRGRPTRREYGVGEKVTAAVTAAAQPGE